MRYTGHLLGIAMFMGVISTAVQAQTTAPGTPAPAATPAATAPAAPADAAPAPPPTAWTYKGFSASGYADTYYNQNFNDPSTRYSQVQAFNITSDKLSLNSFTGSFAYDPAPVGFKVDFGWGRTYDAFYMSEPKHTDWSRHLLNAYVTLKPAAWKGLQLDFGKFVTSAGAEVTESHLNWNYSRSLLFAFGPYYHVGLRATAPIKPNWTVGGQVITGWNVMRDNNTGKTMGFTSVNTFSKVTIANNYYTGPENTGTNTGWRNFYDLAATFTPTSRISAYYNLDIGKNKSPASVSQGFWGMAGAARFTVNKYLAVSPRLEYYSDSDGFWTGTPQAFKEFTLTGEWKFNESFISRVEYRKDWSDMPYFQVGQDPFTSKHQTLFVASMIVVLKPGLFDFGGKAKP
jgi:hypothetical protein